MILLAMLLASADYPAFDPAMAAKVCATDAANLAKLVPDPTSTPAEDCIRSKRADYRRFLVVAANADAAMAPSIAQCLKQWTKDGVIDWGMVEFCAVGNIDGKRDFALLRKVADRELRPAIDKCVADKTDEGAAPDWDDVADCARDQTSGQRDFRLFLAAAKGDERPRIEACLTGGKVVDWDSAVDCAAAGGRSEEPADDGAIVVT